MVNRRETTSVIRAVESASRKYPELPSAHVVMYEIFLQMKEPKAARLELEKAIKANSSDPEPYTILGNIALQERRVAEAELDFDKAQQLLAKYTSARRKKILEQQTMSGIAQVAEANKNWKEAEARLRDYLNLAPEDPLGHQRLAHSLFWQSKAADAYDVLKAAKEIDREIATKNNLKEVLLPAEAVMAQYYDQFEGSRTGRAEEWFKAALKIAPDDLPTRQVVANWALENGKLAFAKEQAEAALRIEASDPKKYSGSKVGHMLRGRVALWEKDWPEAERNYKAIVNENPNDFGAKNDMALALVEQDDGAKKKRALAYAEGNYSVSNRSPESLLTLGWVHFRRNEFDQAGVFLNAALEATGGKMNADTAAYVAHILHHQQKDWQAKEILTVALGSNRPFSMRPEAKDLYEKVKDAKSPPDATPAAKTP